MDRNEHEKTTLVMSAARSMTLNANQCIKGHCPPSPLMRIPHLLPSNQWMWLRTRHLYIHSPKSKRRTRVGYLFSSLTLHSYTNSSVRVIAETPIHHHNQVSDFNFTFCSPSKSTKNPILLHNTTKWVFNFHQNLKKYMTVMLCYELWCVNLPCPFHR
jgi:hypothetical protein